MAPTSCVIGSICRNPVEVLWVSSCSCLCQHILVLSNQFGFKQDKLFSCFFNNI